MAVIGREVRRAVPLPLGVQVLAAANEEAIAVALACGATFVRVEGFVFAHVADEGLVEADAGPLLRYRAAVGAEHVRVFADIKKKHSAHAITADVDVVETAHAAEFCAGRRRDRHRHGDRPSRRPGRGERRGRRRRHPRARRLRDHARQRRRVTPPPTA